MGRLTARVATLLKREAFEYLYDPIEKQAELTYRQFVKKLTTYYFKVVHYRENDLLKMIDI
jgi:hypothetical protein